MTDNRPAIRDPLALAKALGLPVVRQSRGVLVCCPIHGEKTPSLSLTLGRDGTVRCVCHGCQWRGDALSLIAHVRGLDIRAQFAEVLRIGREIAGDRSSEPPESFRAEYSEDYPTAQSLSRFRASMGPLDSAAHALFGGRKIQAGARREMVYSLTGRPDVEWATLITSKGPVSWYDRGYRVILPVFDSDLKARSVRAWKVRGSNGPKRIPPRGVKATGLALMSRATRSYRTAEPLWVVEGETDFLSVCTAIPGAQVLGVVNGTWNDGWSAFVARFGRVIVCTHGDRAGDKYAGTIDPTGKFERRRPEGCDLNDMQMKGELEKWLDLKR